MFTLGWRSRILGQRGSVLGPKRVFSFLVGEAAASATIPQKNVALIRCNPSAHPSPRTAKRNCPLSKLLAGRPVTWNLLGVLSKNAARP
jgi:hypothetical protein